MTPVFDEESDRASRRASRGRGDRIAVDEVDGLRDAPARERELAGGEVLVEVEEHGR